MDLLRAHSGGLIALSACLGGRIPRLISAGNYEGAKEYAKEMYQIFGSDRFYLEVQDHGLSEQKIVNDALYQMSEQLGIGLVFAPRRQRRAGNSYVHSDEQLH